MKIPTQTVTYNGVRYLIPAHPGADWFVSGLTNAEADAMQSQMRKLAPSATTPAVQQSLGEHWMLWGRDIEQAVADQILAEIRSHV